MQSQPAPPNQHLDPDNQRYLEIVNELIETAAEITRTIRKQAAEPGANQDHTIPLERITRTMTRAILLAHRIKEARPARDPKSKSDPAPDPIDARKHIIREVEDAIQLEAQGPRAESLHAELRERLELPDLEHDIATRPIPDIVDEIRNDLGLGMERMPGNPYQKRRTPKDVEILHARAARLPIPDPGEPPASYPPDPPPDPAGLIEHVLNQRKYRSAR